MQDKSRNPVALIGVAVVAVVVTAGVLSLLATSPSTPKSTTFGARTGTVADVHGNASVAGGPRTAWPAPRPFLPRPTRGG